MCQPKALSLLFLFFPLYILVFCWAEEILFVEVALMSQEQITYSIPKYLQLVRITFIQALKDLKSENE
jgi:hypothetical protein